MGRRKINRRQGFKGTRRIIELRSGNDRRIWRGNRRRGMTDRRCSRCADPCEKAKIPVFYKQDSKQKMPTINGKIYAQFPGSKNNWLAREFPKEAHDTQEHSE